MPTQEKIPTTRAARIAALAGAGAKVGINCAAHYTRSALGFEPEKSVLDFRNARDIFATLSQLKGGPLKLAQMLSTDRQLLPEAYAEVFSQAHYSAPPLSYPLVARTFKREFGHEPGYFFEEFSSDAVAGASIGQVHKARRARQYFAVKVQYPGVAESLRTDLAVVKPLALRLFGLRESDVEDYFREVEERLLEETDYQLELERSLELAGQCLAIPNLRFPRFYREFSSKKILTSEWIEGVTLDKFADSDAPQQLRDTIGQALWDFYHHQIHRLRFFHADPHPGNFLVSEQKLVVLDFGCTKKIEPDFYRRHFAFLDPAILRDTARLETAMREMRLILPEDSQWQVRRLVDVCRRFVALLAQPFHSEIFDFGDPSYLASIRELGEQSEREGFGPSTMRGARGCAHSLYLNRAYFGIYNLLARLRARVKTGGFCGEVPLAEGFCVM